MRQNDKMMKYLNIRKDDGSKSKSQNYEESETGLLPNRYFFFFTYKEFASVCWCVTATINIVREKKKQVLYKSPES